MELKKIFTAESKSTWDVLDRGTGFYIPPYQRQYDWDEGHIKRLFEDIGHGLTQLLRKEKKDSITFIGTLIVIDDTQPETIAPNIARSDLPGNGKILEVIDGQQRLTTILLMNICLHDEITRRGAEFNEKDELAFRWLYDRTIEVSAELQETFEEDKRRGEGVYRWQPRMTRAYHDSWARSEREAKYESPIAAFIHGYSRHIHDDTGSEMSKSYTGEGYINKSDILWGNYEKIQNLIEIASSSRNNEDLEVLPLKEVAEDVQFQEAILKEEFPEDVCDILSNEGNDDFKELIQLVFFANFLMHRVGVTVVSAPGAYAFDMFESLNTTGEPLTVLETFRPKVIEFEKLDKYENSDSRKYMRPIEQYLGQFNTSKERQGETSNLLIPFALAESGKKLSSDSLDQRRYMRNQYENLQNKGEKRNFVRHLSHVADFMAKVWKKEDRAFPSITEFTDRSLVLMCMDVLAKTKHHITIGPLARFYSKVLLAPPDSRAKAVNELEEAIKAMTAFFALWRGSGRTTGSLADQYRQLMARGFDEEGIQPFSRSRTADATLANLTAENLRKILRYTLKEGSIVPPNTNKRKRSIPPIASKEDWVRLSASRPVYQLSQPLTRFLLFASIHDTTEDNECLGLPHAGREEILNMFTWDKWNQDLTIEHVAPQKRETSDWAEPSHENPDLVDCLGNLTLLPKAENSSASNRSWTEKKEMYCLLSSSTQDELETRLTDAENRGIQLHDSTKELLRNGKYFQHLSTLCNTEEWSDKFVRKRSRRLAELVWTNIAPWLRFDEE